MASDLPGKSGSVYSQIGLRTIHRFSLQHLPQGKTARARKGKKVTVTGKVEFIPIEGVAQGNPSWFFIDEVIIR